MTVRVTHINQRCWCILFVGLTLSTPSVPIVSGEILSPSQVVQLWIQVYPLQMYQASRFTTVEFRKGLSKEEWVALQEQALKDLQFHYLGGKVVSENVEGDQAVVLFHAEISTILGEHIQEEQYILKKQLDGGWLIDEIMVGQEQLLGNIR